jgi:hypothetical protein
MEYNKNRSTFKIIQPSKEGNPVICSNMDEACGK